MKFSIYTLGCRVNQYESRVISDNLTELGYIEANFNEKCDIYIINSCAVTSESVRKSRQIIRRAFKGNSDAKIIVTGCFSQISPDEVYELGCTDIIIGNKDKIHKVISSVINSIKPDLSDINFENAVYENCILKKPKRFREYIKIQDGCGGKCAYCVIPRARGPIRSKPRESVIQEVKLLAAQGVKEVIMTGIEIAAYEFDLASLLAEIDITEGIERISLGSLEPTLITEDFAHKLSLIKKLTPHFHISVQSGSTSVLNRMRRKYNAKRLQQSIDNLKKHFPHLTLTCDIIVGFPGESDEEFEETRVFLEKNRFLHAHVFPYSIRPETKAAEMKCQIPENVKFQRCSVLDILQKNIKAEILNTQIQERKAIPVLFESFKDGVNHGHSDNYIEFKLESDKDLSGKMIRVVPSFSDGETITAILQK